MSLRFTCINRIAGILILAALLPQIAVAAGIESLINPGPLSEAHAETEAECEGCHAPFSREDQTRLCLDCHEDITSDRISKINLHGRNAEFVESECRACHTEHEGRGSDITGLVHETFDHSLTEYPLEGVHKLAQCASCHQAEVIYRETPNECAGCHESDDAHRGGLGENCGDCHDPEGWSAVSFDHLDTTDFALTGRHADQPCAVCHIDQQYAETPSDCVDCHKLDDAHQGSRGSECGTCHTSEDWQTSEFDHTAETGFELAGDHATLQCGGCHLKNMSLAEPPTTCVGCHSADDIHLGSRGNECAECHSEETWQVEFDHAAESGFVLAGAHSELRCESCHTTNLTDELPTDCEGCHEDTDPHAGTLGACDSCHGQASWVSKLRFDHEFTRFPLVGLHTLATCDQCHETMQFDQAPETCTDCHSAEDSHFGTFGAQCDQCHTPGGWELWTFDHDSQTTFALSGAHQNLVCASCHSNGSGVAENLASDCINCHLTDDRHNGQFGRSCDRCHTTVSFDDNVRFR